MTAQTAVPVDDAAGRDRRLAEKSPIGSEDRHEILGPRQDVDVGLVAVAIPGQPLVRLPGNGWNGQGPAEAGRAIA
jgi:hypothetical protein